MFITSDYTLDEIDSLDLEASPGIKVQVRQGATVNVTFDGDVSVNRSIGDVTGLVTTASTQGAALIEVNGAFSVTAAHDNATATGLVLQGAFDELTINGDLFVTSLREDAVGAFAQGSESELDNYGLVRVSGRGQAIGLQGGETSSVVNFGQVVVEGQNAVGYGSTEGPGAQFVNFGDVRAHAVLSNDPLEGTPIATGVGVFGGFFLNHGHVLASAKGVAIGAAMLVAQSAVNSSDGVIDARAQGKDAVAIGVLMNSFLSTPNLFQNQGLVRADMAFTSTFPAIDGQAAQETPSADIVDNTGKVIGDISLGQNTDTVSNAGVLKGDVFLGSENDTFDSTLGKFSGAAFGGDGDDTLLGSGGSEALWGDDSGVAGGGDDFLAGYKGDDTLFGGDGQDQINGGRGADELWGGTGGDTFVYARATDSGQGGFDVIVDLDSLDTIDLHRIDADVSTVEDDAFHLASSFSHTAGELVIEFDEVEGDTIIRGDINGDALTDFTVILAGDHTGFTNFVL